MSRKYKDLVDFILQLIQKLIVKIVIILSSFFNIWNSDFIIVFKIFAEGATSIRLLCVIPFLCFGTIKMNLILITSFHRAGHKIVVNYKLFNQILRKCWKWSCWWRPLQCISKLWSNFDFSNRHQISCKFCCYYKKSWK